MGNGLSVRGDSLYCPLPLSLDSYWNCFNDCWHCYLRHLNHVWGSDLRPLNVEEFRKKLRSSQRNSSPKTVLAHCLAQKKTIRWGNKSDPFQMAERKHQLAPAIFDAFIEFDWSFVIQTMSTDVMMDYEDHILKAGELATIMPVISPGLDRDWEILERKRTNPPSQRLWHARRLQKKGINVGVNGEPFIPGFHTEEDWREVLKLLVSYGIKSYNVYNLHLNPFVAKRLHSIGLDIEKIWTLNQDKEWKKILKRLLAIAGEYPIRVGCPDFVNSGWGWVEKANTCCGVNVPNPTTYNTHNMKRLIQKGEEPEEAAESLWDGSGDKNHGLEIACSKSPNKFYTMWDALRVK